MKKFLIVFLLLSGCTSTPRDIRRKFGINILGIKRAGKTDVSVTPDTLLSGDITILALGEYKALQKCFRI